MNIHGHTYVAYKITGKLDSLILVGSHVNDLVPFVPNSVLTFEEVHESPEIVYSYLKENNPEYIHFSLAMMTHSVKYGADQFNKNIDEWLLDDNPNLLDEFAKKISSYSKIPYDSAKLGRMHNYLWAGLDVHIVKNKPKFNKLLLKSFDDLDLDLVADILAKSFIKSREGIRQNLNVLFDPFFELGTDKLNTVEGYTRYLKLFFSNLPEKDDVNVSKTADFLEEIQQLFAEQWDEILETVIEDTRKRMAPFLTTK